MNKQMPVLALQHLQKICRGNGYQTAHPGVIDGNLASAWSLTMETKERSFMLAATEVRRGF